MLAICLQQRDRTGSNARRLYHGLFEDKQFPRGRLVGHAAEIETAGQFGSAEATAVEQMTEAELLRCIAKLPDGYRAVLNLFAIEGYSHKEIAAMLNISEGTSRSQYLRAKVFLQRLLQKEEII